MSAVSSLRSFGLSGSDQPRDRVGGLFHLRRRVTLPCRVHDAVGEVILEQPDCDGVQGALRGRDLGEDVDAVGVLVDHPLQAADLSLDPPETAEQCTLVTGVTVRAVTGHDDLVFGHAASIPPAGIGTHAATARASGNTAGAPARRNIRPTSVIVHPESTRSSTRSTGPSRVDIASVNSAGSVNPWCSARTRWALLPRRPSGTCADVTVPRKGRRLTPATCEARLCTSSGR